jgi:predicted alpha/beta-fold hydrolase
MLGRHLIELKELPQLQAAMSVCAPIDLERSSLAIDKWRNKHLDSYYVCVLVRQLIERGLIDAKTAHQKMGRWTLRAFDEGITAPLGGFLNRSHYYETCSPRNIVANITCPTIVLAAADDPIVPLSSVKRAPYSHRTLLNIQRSGGHLGFLARRRTSLGDLRWLDAYIVRWAQEFGYR